MTSSQIDIHPRLQEVVSRHLEHRWQQPIREHNRAVFTELAGTVDLQSLIFDLGCGVGESTTWLARQHPDCLVVGVDRSAARLRVAGATSDLHRTGNKVLVRSDVEDFVRLAVQSQWRAKQIWLLYPNPSPKSAQLKRRWHAHPVWPDMLALGGRLEMRTNWKIYALEMQWTLNYCQRPASVSVLADDHQPITPFERKYQGSGQPLYRVNTKRRVLQ
ncbi:MAG: hypothetical protein DHS20C11_38570 [Lysobacteraceae bacterium]|nr:MAG: hypothetical protein DHS20C11_38570 [Xanthomonadaceae bacterium]